MRLVDVAAGEDVEDLPDAVDRQARVPNEAQVVGALRLEREVVPIRRPFVVARLAGERPCDDAADGVLSDQDLARGPAAVVQLLERDGLLVRGDLEDRVGGRVDDPLAGLLMLLAELLDDVRPRRGLVPEHAAPGPVHERVDHVVGEAVRIGRERLRRQDAHQLPVAGGRVLALRALGQPAGDGGCARLRRTALERLDVAETERLETRKVEPADRARHVAERVGTLVAVVFGVGHSPRSHGVQHDDARAGHAAILSRWIRLSVCSACSSSYPA